MPRRPAGGNPVEELRVPIQQIDVVVHTDRGQTLTGRLYLSEGRDIGATPFRVLELLDDDREFLPFRTNDAHPRDIAINKDHIVRVRVATDGPMSVDDAMVDGHGSEECFSVVLSDGSSLRGRLAVTTPRAASRLVDKLNNAGRFIPLVRDDSVELVHRRHVLSME
ncbi:MAG: hypothetical protein ACE5IK_09290 [Acidobacteriota bacterium]